MELSNLQNNILNSTNKKIVVISSAASGKTRLMTEKVRQLMKTNVDPKKVAVITFTNMAAEELRQRLGEDYKKGLFVGTIHALANYFLLSSGIKTSDVLDKENFDELFQMVEQNPKCIKHMEWILLDEGQDSDELQFKFLFQLINPECFFICADPKQSIYRWKGSNPELVQELSEREDVVVFHMNENYRNGFNILKYAKNLIKPTGLIDDSISMRKGNGAVTEIPFDNKFIINKIKESGLYSTWAILCRTNKEVDDLSFQLSANKIPHDTFKQGDLSKAELNLKMAQNTVKVLTVHSAKGLEWDNVVVVGTRYTSQEERSICYVAATRAKDNLIWTYYQQKKQTPKTYNW